MGDIDLVSQVGRFETNLSAPQALATVRSAIDGVGRVNLARAHIIDEQPRSLTVEIRPASPIGMLADDTQFTVALQGSDGACEVVVEASTYTVYREKILFFIPFGPRIVPGAKVYSRCLRAIDAALHGS